MALIGAVVAVAVLGEGGSGCHGKGAEMSSGAKEPFDVASTPALLGFEGGRVESISPFLPSAYWVIVRPANGSGGGPRIVIVKDGVVDLSEGKAAAARYLRRVRIDEHPEVKAWELAKLLERFNALPDGFSGSDTGTFHPITKETGGLTLTPFALKLISPGYEEPWPPPRDELPSDQPTPPPTGSGPVEGPAGPPPAQPAPPGAAGLRPFVPVARAILRGDETRHYVWTVELWDYDRNRWVEKHRIPLEP